jgi:radical SAM superfamily enzyme YgiQ (UPF0313 family)
MKIHFYYLNIKSTIGYPDGLGLLSSILKKEGHEVFATHIRKRANLEKVVQEDMAKFNPDVVGVSVYTTQAKYVPSIVKSVKKNSKATIIAGGVHATFIPQDLKEKGIDYVFQGEAENSLLEFITKLQEGKDVNNIRGIWPNPLAPLTDLSKIPQVDRNLLDFKGIIEEKNRWVGVGLATRGCPYKCAYCGAPVLNKLYKENLNITNKQILRRRPSREFIKEIKSIEETYPGIKMFVLEDDTFCLNKEYGLDLLKKYEEEIKTPFCAQINLLSFDEDIAKALKSAGCYEIKVGVETGSNRLRNQVLNKHISNEKIIEQIEIAHEKGLNVSCFNMIGLPTETHQELKDTLKLNAKIRPRRMKFSVYLPLSGSPLRDYCKKMNLLNYKKLGKLNEINVDTALKFNSEYMEVFNDIWKSLDIRINELVGEDYYERLPGSYGMIIKKGTS